MNKLLSVLIVTVFSAFTFSVVAANTAEPGVGAQASKTQTVRPAKKYQKESKKREMKEEKSENKKHERKETKAQEMKEK